MTHRRLNPMSLDGLTLVADVKRQMTIRLLLAGTLTIGSVTAVQGQIDWQLGPDVTVTDKEDILTLARRAGLDEPLN
jgi:hypothetical protein